MKKVLIYGIGGKIGHTLVREINKFDALQLAGGVDKFAYNDNNLNVPVFKSLKDCTVKADIIIDFSRPDALDDILTYALANKTTIILATTGYTDAQRAQICDASKHIPVFTSANMSIGVNLLIDLSKKAAQFFGNSFDIEIIEQHHKMKVDAPSGTALTLADSIKSVLKDSVDYQFGRQPTTGKRTDHEIGIHSIRGGNIVGKHDVMFIGNDETVTLSHEAQSRDVFALGALRVATFMADKPVGLYSMNDIIGQDFSVTAVSSVKGVTLFNIPDVTLNSIIMLLAELSKSEINLDMISETPNGKNFNLSFTVFNADENKVSDIIKSHNLAHSSQHADIVRIIGAGMEHKSGVAGDVVKLLTDKHINIFAITTSETQITCCINEASSEKAISYIKEFYHFN